MASSDTESQVYARHIWFHYLRFEPIIYGTQQQFSRRLKWRELFGFAGFHTCPNVTQKTVNGSPIRFEQ